MSASLFARGLFRVSVLGIVSAAASAFSAAGTVDQDGKPPNQEIRPALNSMSEQVQALVLQTSPSVLQVVTSGFSPRHDDADSESNNTVTRETGIGTGFLVSSDGDVITNAHVVEGARRVRVRVHDPVNDDGNTVGHLTDARVVGVDPQTDLALLKVAGRWEHLQFADSANVRQGQIVLALGNPRGLENSVSLGVISATGRLIHPDSPQAFIQTDAPINPGNSGGPLVNIRGEVVGVNTFIVSESGGSEGLGFAVPGDLVQDIYTQLKKFGRVRRGSLGVVIRTVTPSIATALKLSRETGVLVMDVERGSGAAEAGLRTDDIIVAVQGREVRNVRQFSSSLFRAEIGEPVTLDVSRDGKRLTMKAPLDEAKESEEALMQQVKDRARPMPELGILAVALDASTAELVDPPRRQAGTIVAAVLDAGAAFEEPLKGGDVILGVNGRAAENPEVLKKLLSGISEDAPLVVQVQREGVLRYILLRSE